MFTDRHQEQLLQFRRNLFGYACALCDDVASAEDLYQDALVRAMAARDVPSPPDAFRRWMFRVLRNLWIDRMRARRREAEMLLDHDIAESVPAASTGGEETVLNRLLVRHAFMRLCKVHRDVLALVDIGGFSYEETASLLDVPKGTVMSRVSRARAALSRELLAENTPNSQVVALPRRGITR